MASKVGPNDLTVSLTFPELGPSSDHAICRVVANSPSIAGLEAKVEVEVHARVKYSSPQHAEVEAFSETFTLDSIGTEFRIPRTEIPFFSYAGDRLDVEVRTRVTVDDAILFDSKVEHVHDLQIPDKPHIKSDPWAIEPTDHVHVQAGLAAIPGSKTSWQTRLSRVLRYLAGVIVVVGLHDAFVGGEANWVLPDDTPELVLTGILAAIAVAAAHVVLRSQLKDFMTFAAKPISSIRPGQSLQVGDLIEGRTRVAVDNGRLRIVAYNVERGRYVEGSGTDRRVVDFEHPVRPVVLYDQLVPHIPAHASVGDAFPDVVDFDPVFAALYPPLAVGKRHGIGVRWVIQFVHPIFVDHKVDGPAVFAREDFVSS